MISRRALLAAGVLAIAATAPSRVRASVEAEGVDYAGTTAGSWACGPRGRANYGGVGARVRVSEEKARFGGAGATAELAAAGEHESVKVQDCGNDCDQHGDPPARIMLGGHVRAGYQASNWGFEAGGTAYQGWEHPGDGTPSMRAFPDIEFRLGPRESARFVVGVGSPLTTMLRRPGGYLGLDLAAGTIDLQARFGVYRAGPSIADDRSTRGDLVALVPIVNSLELRLGASASGNDVGA
ncbi:MAG TPA: hypothetical protein VF395_14170, partial [Polyangiaceae bacterium]